MSTKVKNPDRESTELSAEEKRLEQSRERTAHWKRWGPYLSERAWGTVREDYSANGTAWDYLPHDHARSKAYRWNEDGLAGISDRHQMICFALALWNGRDPILKERLFGLTGSEGNHGEDVKEYYFYLDSTPTHSYMKYLYKYPQAAFPYAELVAENRRRDKRSLEYELIDTGVFNEDRYFDVFVEYAKADAEDMLIRISVVNRGPEAAQLHLLPTLWFRNTWSWGRVGMDGYHGKPTLRRAGDALVAEHETLGRFRLVAGDGPDGRAPALLFTENETNAERLFGAPSAGRYTKDAFHRYVVDGDSSAVNPAAVGTKAAAHYVLEIAPGAELVVRLRLHPDGDWPRAPLGQAFDSVFAARTREANDFYDALSPSTATADERAVARQAYAGLLWTKQFFH
ncbi:MAG TPA: hypothetical protein VD966_09255, partial [Pyrinomonadaceae bacterium]|nr:hypothetical protein [Pyrinomonadaceae bacterium]